MPVKNLADIVCDEMNLKDVEYYFAGGKRGWIGDSPFVHLDTSKAKELLLEKFKKENVDTKKIEILDRTKTFQEHLEYFNKINLCLDTFPYPGVTTTFQSVLMGVPVLTMKGFNFNSRCGESINKNLGLDKLIANDYDDYLRIAINFRKNTQVDEVYKKKIRENALKSNLFDTETFANDFAKIIKSIS